MAINVNNLDMKSVIPLDIWVKYVRINNVIRWTAPESQEGTIGTFASGFDDAPTNKLTRINTSGVFLSETTVAALLRRNTGTGLSGMAMFYCGRDYNNYLTNILQRIDINGTRIGDNTFIGLDREHPVGASFIDVGMFYGGWNGSYKNTVTRANTDGAIIGVETNVGLARYGMYGIGIGQIGLFYGGWNGAMASTLTRITRSGEILGIETTPALNAKYQGGSAGVGYIGLIYAGYDDDLGANTNVIDRIDPYGAVLSATTAIGTARYGMGSASLNNGMFYGGYSTEVLNATTRIDSAGVIVGSETTVGTARYYLGGGSV